MSAPKKLSELIEKRLRGPADFHEAEQEIREALLLLAQRYTDLTGCPVGVKFHTNLPKGQCPYVQPKRGEDRSGHHSCILRRGHLGAHQRIHAAPEPDGWRLP